MQRRARERGREDRIDPRLVELASVDGTLRQLLRIATDPDCDIAVRRRAVRRLDVFMVLTPLPGDPLIRSRFLGGHAISG